MNPFVGVDIGGTKMYMLAGWEGNYYERRLPSGPSITPQKIKKALAEFIGELPFPVTHVGMTAPGAIENHERVILADGLFHLTDMHAADVAGEGYDVCLLGDLQAAGDYELQFYEPDQTVLVVMVGTAIAMSGQQGGRRIGSDIGYAPIKTKDGVYMLNELVGGYPLLAGKRDTAEEYLRKFAACEADPTDEEGRVIGSITADEFMARVRRGEEKECRLLDEAGFYLGLALSDYIVNFFPDVIVLGGGTMQYPGLYDHAVEVARKYTLPFYGDKCEIRRTHGDPRRVAAQGARIFAMKYAGEDPAIYQL